MTGIALALLLVTIAVGLASSARRSAPAQLVLAIVGPTNMAGVPGMTFEVQRRDGGRVLTGEGYYWVGPEHWEPPGSWQCSIQSAIQTRLQSGASFAIARGPLLSFGNGAPSGSRFSVPVPTNTLVWRLALNVNPEMRSRIARTRVRLQLAWWQKDPLYLTCPMYCGTDSTWVESGLITNAQVGPANGHPRTP